MKQVEQWRNMQ